MDKGKEATTTQPALRDLKDYYTLRLRCSNCGDDFLVWIPKGTFKHSVNVSCTNCECRVNGGYDVR